MRPLLRQDLAIEKTDQAGQTQYLVTEPTLGRSYRLYEVEFLIAKMFDGETEPATALQRAHDELGFDANADDFRRFIEQLVELGFVSDRDAPLNAASTPALFSATGGSLEHEKERLVRSGILHVKQGMFSQARDHFLAAKRCDPADGKIAIILNHFDVVGEDNGPSELEYLWKQTSNLYPELCAEVGAPGAGVAPIPVESGVGRERAIGFGRSWGSIIGVSLVVIALLAVVALGVRATLFPTIKSVQLDRARAQKTSVYFDAVAESRQPRKQWKLKFGKPGVVAEISERADDSVKAGRVIARLTLPAALEKQYKSAKQQRLSFEKTELALSLQIERELAQINDKQEALRQLKEKAAAAKAANQRKELAAFDKRIAAANKDLTKQRQMAQKPRVLKDKVDKALRAAEAAEAKVIATADWAFIRAPEDAFVQAINFRVNGKVGDAQDVVLIDRSAVRVVFAGKDERLKGVAVGSTVRLQSEDNTLVSGTVVAVGPGKWTVELVENIEALTQGSVGGIRWIKETLNDAVVVAASAKVGDDSVWIVTGDKAYRKTVAWLDTRGKDAFAKSGLKPGDVVVVGPPETLSGLTDGDRIAAIDTAGAPP